MRFEFSETYISKVFSDPQLPFSPFRDNSFIQTKSVNTLILGINNCVKLMFEMFSPCKALLLVLLFSVTILPEDTEAVSPFFAAFVRLGYKLVKNTYYARCNIRLTPPGQ